MEIILSHNNLDCDGLAAMLAMSRLRPGARPVLMGGLNRNVRDLLERDQADLRFGRLRDLPKEGIERIILVDAQTLPADEGLMQRVRQNNPAIEIYDHHPLAESLPAQASLTRADTGATTTILVEMMQEQRLPLSPSDASILILGIYEDTGHLTYTTTTPRDMRAAAWLLEQGADLKLVTDYIDRPLSPRQWQVFEDLQSNLTVQQISGYAILLAAANAPDYVEEISTLAHKLTDQNNPDAAFVLVQMNDVVQVIARSRNDAIDVSAILKPLGGGGHAPAAAALVRGRMLEDVQAELWETLRQGVAPSVVAADIMTRELHSVTVGTTIVKVYDALLRYGHEALPIMDNNRLVGLIMRRDAEKAMHHGLGARPVEAFATYDMPTISPRTSLVEIQNMMTDNNTGQMPVVEGDRLLGIVTRTDVIRRWRGSTGSVNLADRLNTTLASDVLNVLTIAGETASALGFSLFLVGGFVRDLLLGIPNVDLDLVVEGDAITLATRLVEQNGGRATSHTHFGTAKWMATPADTHLGLTRSLALDLVTARTEFYDHPAALPQVEASSLRHDLYRRDFTINTMAICLNGSRYGDLVDFYGGKADLDRRLIRVIHNLSFVDDATRILRAARLAERLGFDIEERTSSLIADAWDSLARMSSDRLRRELYLVFREAEPERIVRRLDELGVLAHLHPHLRYTPWLAGRYAAVRAALPAWRSWAWGDGGSGGNETTALTATYMALLAYNLTRDELTQLVARLNIAGEVGHILQRVWDLQPQVSALATDLRPSQIHHILRPYLIEAIAAVYIAEDDHSVHKAIASYIETLRHVRTEVDGTVLRSLGIPPGPVYSAVLQGVLDAKLDGNVSSRSDEERLLSDLLAAASTRQ